MNSQISQDMLEQVIRFHGHSCPGLSIGIRAAELARRELGDLPDVRMVCITETDMCGVDAVQYLTGCTFGKGNLIHRDYGKMAFSFFDRESMQGFRCLLRPGARGETGEEMSRLSRKVFSGTASPDEQARCTELRKKMQEHIMGAELDEIFEVMAPREKMPRGARILESLSCEMCGEATMESRTRRFDGKILCQPCFDKVEQKV
jgi:formylmethanofuran dehydrogenase subunit E